MSNTNNPFGSGYGATPSTTTVSFGSSAQVSSGGGDLIKDTTTAGFSKDVIAESKNQPVLVDFWAPWCGPCKQLTPILEKAVNGSAGRVKLVKMNIDDHPAIAGQLGIQSIPAVIAFVDGKPVDGFMGALPESKVTEFINRLASPDGGRDEAVNSALEAARQALDAGDFEQAGQIYSAVLAEIPDHAGGLAGLATCLVEAGDVEAARETLDRVPDAARSDADVRAAEARIALAAQVAQLGDPKPLEARLAANPADHQARYDLAMILNAQGRRDEAADHLLAIMKADRCWNDDGARKQLLQFFDAWGAGDPSSLAARRKLSSLLFS
ncbi:thioredoxin [Phyllobacterium sp. 21LDTY02-6]|uniref:thioredoxin n=1 Tax=Phyllobacterium sp. 21LDTY02-6 TaxID=2944903 RepID=UPI0020207EF2|nr:thioredoxin [Phyllobacterium sp. 21LDTY02-6]MCO4317336.1 thioredoxin [Phyllobacterium sp. 21LDTY02-6]